MPSSPVDFFETKLIQWKTHRGEDRDSNILLQNANGPCPLVALVNTMVLTQQGSMHEYTKSKDLISVNGLLEHLGTVLLERIASKDKGQHAVKESREKAETRVENVEKNVETSFEDDGLVGKLQQASLSDSNVEVATNLSLEQSPLNPLEQSPLDSFSNSKPTSLINDTDLVLGLLPKLVTGLNINPRFDGTFDDSPEMSLFRIYDVDVVHGWICDAQDDAVGQHNYDLIMKSGSYEQSQQLLFQAQEIEVQGSDSTVSPDSLNVLQQAEAVRTFLANNPTQLSSAGIKFLNYLLDPGSIAVLFRNDHFSTIYKPPNYNTLFTLVADSGLAKEPNIVWQSLTSVSGSQDEFFYGDLRSFVQPEATPVRVDPDQDFLLARQLQIDDDAALALEYEQQYAQQLATTGETERPRTAGRRPNRTSNVPTPVRATPRQTTRQARPKDEKSKKDCVIM